MIINEIYENARVVWSGEKQTTVNELTDQIPALRPQALREAALSLITMSTLCFDKIVTEEDKGALMAATIALITDKPLAIARWYNYSLDSLDNTINIPISSEYYEGTLYLNGLMQGDKVVIIDDTISTGGTIISLIKAIETAGAEVVEILCLVEKVDNNGVDRVFAETGHNVKTYMKIRIIDNKVHIL
jgi:adenine phosphoribosyltransferase